MAKRTKKTAHTEFQKVVLKEFNTIHAFQDFVAKQFSWITEQFTEVKGDMQIMKADITEIKDILYPLAKAFDIDTEKTLDYGRRITRLEKHVGLE